MNAEHSFEADFNPQFESTRNDFQRNPNDNQQGGRGRRGSFRRRTSFEEEEVDLLTKEVWKVTFTYEKRDDTYDERN